MNPMPELIPMLKQLRLSGILDSIEARNRQAIEEKFSYMNFLATIIQDEIARRSQKRLALAIRRANFRNQKTLEEFDFTFNPGLNRVLITDLASCRFIEEKVSVLIVGPCGTGKSHIAQALGHSAIRAGYDVLFTTASRMLVQLNASRAANGFERQLAKFAKVDLLIIDDFGLKPLKGLQDEDFHDVISERYERKSTIITSNLLCGAPHNKFSFDLGAITLSNDFKVIGLGKPLQVHPNMIYLRIVSHIIVNTFIVVMNSTAHRMDIHH